ELDEIEEIGDEEEHESQEDDDFEAQDEEGSDSDDEHSSFDFEHDETYHLVGDLLAEGWGFGGDPGRGVSNERPSASSSAGHGFSGLLAEFHTRRDADGDSLFVDRGPNILPPLEELLSNVRRNHVRALGLASELHSQLFGQEMSSRSLL